MIRYDLGYRSLQCRTEQKGVPWFTTELYFCDQEQSHDKLLCSYLAVEVVEAFLCDVFLVCKLGQRCVQSVKLSLGVEVKCHEVQFRSPRWKGQVQ